MQKILECDILKRSTMNLQIAVSIPAGLCMGYLIINMLNAAFDKRLFFPGLLIPCILVFVGGIGGAILIWYRSKGKLVIYQRPNDELEVEISFPTGEVISQKGKWDCMGMYNKTYAKYGMYYKNLALALFCNDQAFCLLRHRLGGLDSEPQGFRHVEQLLNPGATEYWCKKTQTVFRMLKKD